MIIKSVSPASLAKILGSLGVVYGFILGFFAILTPIVNNRIHGNPTDIPSIKSVLYFLLLFPLIMGVGSFVSSIVISLAYNVAAGLFGGLEIDVEESKQRTN